MPAATVTDLPPGQVTPDHSVPWQVELEKVLAGAPAAIEAVAAWGASRYAGRRARHKGGR
ncbi:hypothetical protein BST63_04780 [Bradyrhizobium canariense]|uniref:Uncharacterized protein n=1 Tax=Bradyrhizobium canariense TaxID=255045 RepID=A0ABX3X9D1_9BRAD|nr:hypothetical protein BSR47_05135 [Bradyrhizobium canariense]OSJ33964.1 hypothetical protein BST63_04780 [Bradyrhizobium canariense]